MAPVVTDFIYRQSVGLKIPLCSASYHDIKKLFYGRKTNLGFESELDKVGVIESVEYSVHNHSVFNEVFIFEFKGNYDVLLTWVLDRLHQSIQQIFNEIP